MAKKNSDYWQGRFEQLEKASHKDALTTYSHIEQSFEQAQREIERNINNWYVRFANNNQITITEAKKILNANELKELKWDIQEYIKYGQENELNAGWMKELENASAKFHISRLEALKLQTQQTLEKLFGNELDEVDRMTSNTYTNNYYHTMFEMQKGFNVGFNIGTIDENKLSKIVSKPWAVDEKNFSERIWNNKTKMINELHNQLTIMCVQGKSPDSVIKYMSKKFNTSKAQAGNLVMTESAYFSSLAQKDCFKDLDVEEYEIVATLDSHTSSICQEQDGKIYKMNDYQPGVTAPPFHNYCRSTTVPHFNDDYDIKDTRAARDEDGKTYYVENDIKYKDWYDKYIKNNQDLKNNEKSDKIENNKIDYKPKTVKERYNELKEKEFMSLSSEEKKIITNYRLYELGEGDNYLKEAEIYNNKIEEKLTPRKTNYYDNDFKNKYDNAKSYTTEESSNLEKIYKEQINTLSKQQQNSISRYTEEEFSSINTSLRQEKRTSETLGKEIDDITNSLNKCKTIEDMIVHRHVDFEGLSKFTGLKEHQLRESNIEELNNLLKGNSYCDKAFVSTSIRDFKEEMRDIVYDIHVPKGSKGLYINELSTSYRDIEYEFLLQRESNFKIQEIFKDSDGTIRIVMGVTGNAL